MGDLEKISEVNLVKSQHKLPERIINREKTRPLGNQFIFCKNWGFNANSCTKWLSVTVDVLLQVSPKPLPLLFVRNASHQTGSCELIVKVPVTTPGREDDQQKLPLTSMYRKFLSLKELKNPYAKMDHPLYYNLQIWKCTLSYDKGMTPSKNHVWAPTGLMEAESARSIAPFIL